jgi:tetratricopeptide (TPR) repeat protein
MAQKTAAQEMQELGIDAYRAGEYEEALEAFEKARNLSAQAGDRKGEIETLGSLGVVFVELERWDDARRLLDEASKICDEAGDQVNKGKVLGNMGMMYARQGDEEKAVEAYEQALVIFQELDERGYEKDIARQLKKLTEESRLSEVVGGLRDGLAYRWEASGVPTMARKLFRLSGRQAGLASEELEEEQDELSGPLPDEDQE